LREVPDALRSVSRFIADVLPEFEVRLFAEEGTFARPFGRVGLASPTQYPVGSSRQAEHIQPMACHLYPTVAEDGPEDHMVRALQIEARLARAVRYSGGGRILVPSPMAMAAALTTGALAAGTYRYDLVAVGRRGSTASIANVSITLATPGGVTLNWPTLFGARRYQLWRNNRLVANVKQGTTSTTWTDVGTATPNPTAVLPIADTATVGAPLRIPLYDYDNVPLTRAASVRGFSDFLRVSDLAIGRQVEDEDERRITITVDLRVTWAHGGEPDPAGGTLLSIKQRPIPS
jgi:hypothetical protein